MLKSVRNVQVRECMLWTLWPQEDVLESGGGVAVAGPSMAMEDPGDDDLDMGYDDGDG